MFYKENYLSHELIEKLKNSPEFIYSYFKKVEYLPYYALGEIQGLDKKGDIIYSMPIVLKSASEDNSDMKEFNAYITVQGMKSLTPFNDNYRLEKVQRENSKVQSINVVNINEEDFLQKYTFNNKLLKHSHAILKDFSNVVQEGTIIDKFHQQYQYCIISNKDPSICDTLIIDEIILFAPQPEGSSQNTPKVKIGSIKAKYVTPDILEQIYFSPFNNEEYDLDTIARKPPTLKKNKRNLSDYIKKYPLKNINNTYHYQSHIEQFEQELKDNIFMNKATIDFSYVESAFKNKGLGYALYFHMAQYLNEKDIQFRQSSICSESAQVLWAAFEKHLPQLVSKQYMNKKELYFLSVPQNYSLDFDNNIPIVKEHKQINIIQDTQPIDKNNTTKRKSII